MVKGQVAKRQKVSSIDAVILFFFVINEHQRR